MNSPDPQKAGPLTGPIGESVRYRLGPYVRGILLGIIATVIYYNVVGACGGGF